jgi:hypothetical protein
LQNYPVADSHQQTGAATVNTLGYAFFGDSIYRLTFTFAHTSDTLALNFSSSLFKGKGIEDESWGLDNVAGFELSTGAWPSRSVARSQRTAELQRRLSPM